MPLLSINKMSITVIIVNWNGGDLLLDCLKHLQDQSEPAESILLMDNGSTDGSAKKAALIPDVQVHFLNENLGFAKANNLALEHCQTEWVALLNPDALADKEWLANLRKAIQAYPDISFFGCQQRQLNFPDYLDGIGDEYHLSGLIWRKGYGKLVSNYKHQAPQPIFSPCACAALYKLNALNAVGGFDEDFFCYVEDIDLGFRLQLHDYHARYIPEAIVYHAGSASSGGTHSDFSIYHGHRNLVWAFIKNMPSILFWTLLPLHIVLNIITIIYFSLKGQGKIIIKAKYDALLGIPKMWKKRHFIQNSKKISSLKVWSLLHKKLISK